MTPRGAKFRPSKQDETVARALPRDTLDLLDQEFKPLKASDEDVGKSLSTYYEAIANFDEVGKKKEALTALTKLLELLERPGSDAVARLHANGGTQPAATSGHGPSAPSGPTFSKMVFRVELMLTNVHKIRALKFRAKSQPTAPSFDM